MKKAIIECPKCKSLLTLHQNYPTEALDDGCPVNCAECGAFLNDACCKQLGWKR
jgi:hypothetical protein